MLDAAAGSRYIETAGFTCATGVERGHIDDGAAGEPVRGGGADAGRPTGAAWRGGAAHRPPAARHRHLPRACAAGASPADGPGQGGGAPPPWGGGRRGGGAGGGAAPSRARYSCSSSRAITSRWIWFVPS